MSVVAASCGWRYLGHITAHRVRATNAADITFAARAACRCTPCKHGRRNGGAVRVPGYAFAVQRAEWCRPQFPEVEAEAAGDNASRACGARQQVDLTTTSNPFRGSRHPLGGGLPRVLDYGQW